jgi:hypothetical protein
LTHHRKKWTHWKSWFFALLALSPSGLLSSTFSEESIMEHPHAWVLRAIADGEPQSNFEVQNHNWAQWENAIEWAGWIHEPGYWQVRRKQKTIKVNGFDVPAPVRDIDDQQQCYVPDITDVSMVFGFNFSEASSWRVTCRDRGLIHLTKENAIAHAKAILGINPNT